MQNGLAEKFREAISEEVESMIAELRATDTGSGENPSPEGLYALERLEAFLRLVPDGTLPSRLANLAEAVYGVPAGAVTVHGFLRDMKISNERDSNGSRKDIICAVVVDSNPMYRVALAEMLDGDVNITARQLTIADAERAAEAEAPDESGQMDIEAEAAKNEAVQAPAADDPRVNEHGVFISGVETLEIPFSKTLKAQASIELVEAAEGGWRVGYWLDLGTAGGASTPPSNSGESYPTRDMAIEAAVSALVADCQQSKHKKPEKLIEAVTDWWMMLAEAA